MKHQNLVISQNWKNLNKVGVAEEIGCENDVALSKIGQIEWRLVKNHVPGWMVVHGWMEIIAVLRIAYTNKKLKVI